MRVFVYYNLHRKQFSVRALSGPDRGRVIHHADVVEILDATFKVSEAGRQRVLREKRKNVHAGVIGTLGYHGPVSQPHADDAQRVAYNPYKVATFVTPDGFPVRFGRRVVLGTHASWVEGGSVCDCGGFFAAGAYVHPSACTVPR